MQDLSRENKSTSLLFRDRTAVCSIAVQHFLCKLEKGAFVEFRNADSQSPLEYRYAIKLEDWEVDDLRSKIHELLQHDSSLNFCDFQGFMSLEILVSTVLADVFPVTLVLNGSVCEPERVDGVLYSRFGGSLILKKFTTNRESLTCLLELLKSDF